MSEDLQDPENTPDPRGLSTTMNLILMDKPDLPVLAVRFSTKALVMFTQVSKTLGIFILVVFCQ